MWHNAKAKIVYDPPRPGMKSRREWWAVAYIIGGYDICRYYRYQIEKEILNPLGIRDEPSAKKYPHHRLCEPSWGAHVSIIRGEKPRPDLMHLWKKYDGKIIDIRYSHNVRQTGDTTGGDRPDNYWFVEVDAPFLINIRKELQRPSEWRLHMTVGRTWS